jgi:hypothetical protein
MANGIIHGSNYIKKVSLAALRKIFALQEDFPIYKYDDNTANTKILIYGYYPPTAMALPIIVVRNWGAEYYRGTSALGITGIGEKIQQVGDQVVNKEYTFGYIDSTLNIDINTYTDEDRSALTDLTAFYCRYIFPEVFFNFGIGYNDLKVTGEAEKDWAGKRVFSNSIQMKLYTEIQYANMNPVIYIKKLNIELSEYL